MSTRAEGKRIARLLGLEQLPREGGLQLEQPVLGPDLAVGARLQIVVPAGVWQGSSPLGEWTLAGTTVAPPFEWPAFRLGRRTELFTGWSDAAPRIRALTRT
ncbi:MAG: cupin domain-containing protein [Actinomycetota bacterium]|nr:cupin domain-containing protein [Actinomycetota bacterium]